MEHTDNLDQRTDQPTFSIFQDMSQESIDKLRASGKTVPYEVGHTLFERGQDANVLFILEDGVVELLFPVEIMGVTRDVTMESKHRGDVLAWSALVKPYYCTLSARCASKCTLTSFERSALHELLESNPQTGYRFMRNLAGVIGRRLQSMQTIWLRELQASAARRLG